jgi:hypothetical protein
MLVTVLEEREIDEANSFTTRKSDLRACSHWVSNTVLVVKMFYMMDTE